MLIFSATVLIDEISPSNYWAVKDEFNNIWLYLIIGGMTLVTMLGMNIVAYHLRKQRLSMRKLSSKK